LGQVVFDQVLPPTYFAYDWLAPLKLALVKMLPPFQVMYAA
jgi:hypothetical protein